MKYIVISLHNHTLGKVIEFEYYSDAVDYIDSLFNQPFHDSANDKLSYNQEDKYVHQDADNEYHYYIGVTETI